MTLPLLGLEPSLFRVPVGAQVGGIPSDERSMVSQMPQDLTAVHPELRQTFQRIPKLSFNRGNLRLIRWLSNLQRAPKAPADVRIENRLIPGPDPKHKLRLRTYRAAPLVAPAPALLWIHGGGFLIGKPEMDDLVMVQFARDLGILIVSVDYSMAPEHPFPIPLEECYTALRWVHSQASLLGIDPDHIAIGGASAGGGLAATLVQLAHDRAEIHPIFQLLIYPMLDDRTSLRRDIPNKDVLLWSQASNRFGWESYLHQSSGLVSVPPYSVAARRADLSGFPPAWIGVGTLDLFYDEDVSYAQRLNESGVACELVIVPGAFHGFDVGASEPQVVQDFRKSQIVALRQHLFRK